MNDKKFKKLKLDRSKMEELKGFEEVIDIFFEEEEKEERELYKKKISSSNETHELYNFLEDERARLKLLNEIFTTKLRNLKEYPQAKNLALYQKQNMKSLHDEVVNISKEKGSILYQQLELLFNKSFKKYSTGQDRE